MAGMDSLLPTWTLGSSILLEDGHGLTQCTEGNLAGSKAALNNAPSIIRKLYLNPTRHLVCHDRH